MSLFSSNFEFEHNDSSPIEIDEGVTVERRGFLCASALTAAVTLLGATALKASSMHQPVDPTLDLEGFLKECLPLGEELLKSGGKNEDSYLFTLSALLARMSPPDVDVGQTMRTFRKQHQKKGTPFPITVVAMNLKPGRGFRHHDHRDYNGVILGLEGEVRIRNFDILGDELVPPKGKTFEIREVRDDLVLPGRFSSLALKRENVHELVAGPKGARVLDVFTRMKPNARSYMMDVETKAKDVEKRIYEAAWT